MRLRSAEEGRTALAVGEEQNTVVLALAADLEVDTRPFLGEEGSSCPVAEGFLARSLTCSDSVPKGLLFILYIQRIKEVKYGAL